MKYLKTASELYATAIKLSPKNARLHFRLGQILEEMHFVEDCFGFKQEVHNVAHVIKILDKLDLRSTKKPHSRRLQVYGSL